MQRFPRSDRAIGPVHEPRHKQDEAQHRKREGQSPRFHAMPCTAVNQRHDAKKNCRDNQPMKPHDSTIAETAPTSKPDGYEIKLKPGENPERKKAELFITPYLTNVHSALKFAQGSVGELDLQQSVLALMDRVELVTANNNLAEVEAMLVSQSYALNLMFSELTRRSAINMEKYFEASQKYFSMALKAQNQCRMTLETLANIKNPPVIYARQANVTTGPQQVNNNVNNGHAHATEKQNAQSKKLEQSHEQRLDTGTPGTTVKGNSQMAAVAKSDGAKDC